MKTSKRVKILKFSDEDSWLDARRGKIGGTRAGNLLLARGGGYKIGFWEMLAERVALPPDEENVMDRGKRLETHALELFEKKTGKKVDKNLYIICREDCPEICYSPDGIMGKVEDAEVKCLSTARHLEIIATNNIPSEYYAQMLQGFVVNDSLRTRYFVSYDPRCPKDLHIIPMHRKEYTEEIKATLTAQRQILEEIKLLEDKVTFTP